MLRTACVTAATWSQPFKVAVNVAPMQLNHDLPKRVAEVLRETGLAPERLEIELTETGIIADRQHALQALRKAAPACKAICSASRRRTRRSAG
ncbi:MULTISPECIES: EAL domain-containing protein [unclassified Bradyrhizobium]|uniref:EAL domain-containing protein n=1 Tax=unclassified Bradyrhizobium TaxID=2631580 RepID=UPI002915CC53|nr:MULTISPECIES: EAL domain-containing protein [unclassified Bradyrhizobium]